MTWAASTAHAEDACPTEADLDTGIRFENGIEGTSLTVRRLTDEFLKNLGLESDPNKAQYRHLEWQWPLSHYPRGSTEVRYRGLFDNLISSHLGVAEITYTQLLEAIFPLKIHDHHQIAFTYRVPDFSGGGDNVRPWRYSQTVDGTIVLDVLDQSQITVGNCRFDLLIIRTSRTFSSEETHEDSKPTVDWEYFVPSLGTWIAKVHVDNQPVDELVDGMFDSVRVLRSSEAESYQ